MSAVMSAAMSVVVRAAMSAVMGVLRVSKAVIG